MKRNIRISAGAVFAAALLYYFLDAESILALLAAAAAHELGHLLALQLLGLRVRRIRMEARGFCMDYCGSTGALGHALAAAAGPGAGFLYAYAASLAGNRLGMDGLCLSAGMSLLLSLFNLIPALPLDGGRILMSICCGCCGEQRGRLLCAAASTACGFVLLALGTLLLFQGKGAALLVAAVWVLAWQEGVEKRLEIL